MNKQTMCDRCRNRKSNDKIIQGAYGYKHLCKRCKILIVIEPDSEHRGTL